MSLSCMPPVLLFFVSPRQRGKMVLGGAGEVDRQLRAHTAFAEEPSSIPSIQQCWAAHNLPVILAPGDLVFSYGLWALVLTCTSPCADIHTHKSNNVKIKKSIKLCLEYKNHICLQNGTRAHIFKVLFYIS